MTVPLAERPVCDWSKDTLEPSLGLLLLQPSMKRDKKHCKASIDAQALGHAASTLAQPMDRHGLRQGPYMGAETSIF